MGQIAAGDTLHTDGLVISVSGMGPERAADSARALLATGAEGLLVFGTAGALTPDWHTGDLLVSNQFVTAAGHRVDGGTGCATLITLGQRLGGREAALATVAHPVSSASARIALATRTGAAAVDMESAAVAEVAVAAGMSCVAFRVIVDELDTELPQGLMACIDSYGRPRAALGLWLLRQPSRIRGLLRLGRQLNRAAARLREAGEALRRDSARALLT